MTDLRVQSARESECIASQKPVNSFGRQNAFDVFFCVDSQFGLNT